MKKIFLLLFLIFFGVFNLFSQESTDDLSWKDKLIYINTWAGYGTGFSMGIGVDTQLSNYFALGLEFGLVDKNYPAISIFPKFTFRPWKMEIDLYAWFSFGYSMVYDFIWGIPYGIDIGYNLGHGLLFATVRNGMGWAIWIGYRIGYFERNRRN